MKDLHTGVPIGGVAVLVTLVYLAVQLKQGTTALASNRHREMLDCLISNHFAPFSESRELAEFVYRAKLARKELNETDWDRFVHYAYGTFAMREDALVSRRRGLMDADLWDAWDGAGRSLWSGPGFRKFWAQERDGHTTSFQT